MPNMSDTLNDFVKDTTQKIVDKPESVEVTTIVSTKTVIIQVRVHDKDRGKIIGRQGRTNNALRVLCLAIKNTQFPNDSRHVMIEVLEDENTKFNYNNQ